MKPSHPTSKMLHMLSEDHKPRFFVRRHFLCRLPGEICSHLLQEDIKDPRALARNADELWKNSNGTALNALSDASEDQEVEDLSLLPPVLLHIRLPVLLPVLSLGDQPHQDLVLQGGAGTTGLIEKRLSAPRVPVLMLRETRWPAVGASSLSTVRKSSLIYL